MLRRGLYGAKEWVLEDGKDGDRRGPGSKAWRAAAVAAPLWIVAMPLASDPEKSGGESPAFFSTVLLAAVVTLVGLALFSARERKLGREEPWLENVTESGETGVETLVSPTEKKAPLALESSQVRVVWKKAERVIGGDNNDVLDQKPQIFAPVVPQAVSEAPKSPCATGNNEVHGSMNAVSKEATSEDSAGPGVESARNAFRRVPQTFPNTPWEAMSKQEYLQVRELVEDSGAIVLQATDGGFGSDTAESDRDEVPEDPSTPFPSAFPRPFHGQDEPQVGGSMESDPGTFDEPFRDPDSPWGPYPVTKEPISKTWWLTPPDIPGSDGEKSSATEGEEPSQPHEEAPEEAADDGPPDMEAPATGPYPPEVQRYFASQISRDVDGSERDAARESVRLWAIAEVIEGGRSLSSVARLLGLGKATVFRWVDAGREDDDEQDGRAI